MIKILGRATSSNVQKALWCAAELELDFVHEAEYGGDFARTDTLEYRALNPNGLVPTLIHDDFVLWESHSIIRYLGAVFGAGGLWPTGPKARAASEKWMDWSMSALEGAYFPAFYELIRKTPEQRNQAAVDQAVKDATPLLGILDRALGDGGPFVGGEQLTIGDIVFAPTIHRWFNLDIPRPDTPNVRAWYDNVLQRPAFAKYVAIELA